VLMNDVGHAFDPMVTNLVTNFYKLSTSSNMSNCVHSSRLIDRPYKRIHDVLNVQLDYAICFEYEFGQLDLRPLGC
jgi:hypothetical protein